MRNFDASAERSPVVYCAVCEKAITGGNWFARIRHGDLLVALCCPFCAAAFEDKPAAYARRIEMYARIQDPDLPGSN